MPVLVFAGRKQCTTIELTTTTYGNRIIDVCVSAFDRMTSANAVAKGKPLGSPTAVAAAAADPAARRGSSGAEETIGHRITVRHSANLNVRRSKRFHSSSFFET